MPTRTLPRAATPAGLPSTVRLQIVSSTAAPPEGDGSLHEVKHDGHRLLAIIDSRGGLTLISRNGYDRTHLFREPFHQLAATRRALVLDGEIAVPDERGVTHIDALNDAIASKKQPEHLAYFAFDLLHVDGRDLAAALSKNGRRCCSACSKMLPASASCTSIT